MHETRSARFRIQIPGLRKCESRPLDSWLWSMLWLTFYQCKVSYCSREVSSAVLSSCSIWPANCWVNLRSFCSAKRQTGKVWKTLTNYWIFMDCWCFRSKHKRHCQAQSKGLFGDFGKICRNLMANKVLRHYVEVLIALELDLINKTSTGKPLRVEIWTDFEPSDTQRFVKLFNPSAEIDSSPMQGMFQLCAITSKGIAVDESSCSITAPGVVTITFVRTTGSDRAHFFEISGSVSQEALDFCRRTTELAVPVGSVTGQMLKQPISVLSCIECVYPIYCNNHYFSRLKPFWQLNQRAHWTGY